MRVITNDNLTARVSFDAVVWKQERLTINAVCEGWENTYKYRLARRFDSSKIADYSSADGTLFVDVADFIRDKAERQKTGFFLFVIENNAVVESVEIPIEKIAGLISPQSLHLPPYPFDIDDPNVYTIPPRRMLADFGIRSRVEFQIDESLAYKFSQTTSSGSITPFIPFVSGSLLLLAGAQALRVKLDGSTLWDSAAWNIEPLAACDLYACVEWVGATGAIKRATWHAGRLTAATANDVQLVPDARPFRAIKGRKDSSVLWLDGLTPYDYAYYGDICESSDVRVVFSDTPNPSAALDSEGRIDERFAVLVTTASTTPNDGNAGEFQKLEISIKTAEYDAITL